MPNAPPPILPVRPADAALAVVVAANLALLAARGPALPALVAAHFDASGAVDGFMPRAGYLGASAILGGAVPLLLTALPRRAIRRGAPLRLPRQAYWLRPERRAATVDWLVSQTAWFGAAAAAMLGVAQWAVIAANGRRPPHLDMGAMQAALALFVAFAAALPARVWWRFGRAGAR